MSENSELESKLAELESLKKSYEEFIESSGALERELEDALKESESKCTDLNKKKTVAEEKYTSLYERYVASGNQLTICQKDLTNALEKLANADQKRIALEQRIDELEESVRILEATEEDLTYKLSKSEEDIIFLQNDIDELKSERENSERRLKTELTDIQAELAKYDINTAKDNNESSTNDEHDDNENKSITTTAETNNILPNNNNTTNTTEKEEFNTGTISATQQQQQQQQNEVTDMNIEIIEELELEIEELNERLRETELQNQQLNDEVSRLADELITIHEKHSLQQQQQSQNNDTNIPTAVITNDDAAITTAVTMSGTSEPISDSTTKDTNTTDMQKIHLEEVEKLQSLIATKEQLILETKIQYEALLIEFKSKTTSLNTLQLNHDTLLNNLQITNDSLATINKEIELLKVEKSNLDESLIIEKKKTISYEEEIKKRNTEYEHLQEECNLKTSEIEVLKSQIQLLEETVASVNSTNNNNNSKDISSNNNGDNDGANNSNDNNNKQSGHDTHISSQQWQDEKLTLLREIELLREAVSQSVVNSEDSNNHINQLLISPKRNITSAFMKKNPIINSPRNMTFPETPVSKTTILLDSTEIGLQEIEAVVTSGDINKIKLLLHTKMNELEAMRTSNARLLQKLQAARGNIQVCCRPRPPSLTEIGRY